METIQRDFNKLNLAEKARGNTSLLNVVGYEKQSSAHGSMTYQVTSSNDQISCGGNTVGPGSNVTLTMGDDMTLYYLNRCAIVGEITITGGGLLENAAHLFQAVQMQIGKFTWQMTNLGQYNSIAIRKMSEKKLKKYERGLLLQLSNEKIDGLNADALYAASYLSAHTQLLKTTQQQQDGIGISPDLLALGVSVPYTVQFVVPLHIICPQFQAIDHYTLYTGLSQSLKITLQL